MNHGGIGVLEHIRGTGGLRLLFNSDILQTLSIDEKSTLEGIYYNGSNARPPHPSTIDFVLSPVPYRFWPKVCGIRVRLLSASHAIRDFSAYLASNGVSILHSEYSRSGYRTATWNFVVALDVKIEENDYDNKDFVYKPTLRETKKLESNIRQNLEHLFFHDDDNPHLHETLCMWPITSLAYYHNISRMSTLVDEFPWLYQPFSVSAAPDEIFVPKGNLFTSVLGHLNKDEKQSKLSIYADVSTEDVLLRVAVIPSNEEWRFSRITVEYVRNSPPDTSRGFCAQITKGVPNDIKIWKLTNYTNVNTDYNEIGSASLLLEDRRDRPQDAGYRETCHNEILSTIRETGFSVEGGAVLVRTAARKTR